MKKVIFVFWLCLTLQIGYSQEELGIKLELGASTITNNINDLFEDDIDIYEISYAPSGNIGVFYHYNFSEHSLIGFEGKYSHITSLEKIGVTYIDSNGTSLGQESTELKKRISFLSFPIYYGYTFSKITVTAGIRFSLSISSKYQSEDPYNGIAHGTLEVSQFDYGPRIGILYRLSEKISIEGIYYHGLNNMVDFDTGDFDLVWEVRQITLGIKYTFPELLSN